MEKKTGVTASGFSYAFDAAALDDMLLVDELAVLVDPESEGFAKLTSISRILTMLLGAEQKKALYAHIASGNDGRVPMAVMEEVLNEIIEGAGKNS